MSKPLATLLLLTVLGVGGAAAQAQVVPTPSPTPTRGQLLYATHCIACHNAQVHWRDGRQATDWKSLKEQVRRWQASADLQWSEADIAEVARHLNDTIYRYPQVSDRMSLGGPQPNRKRPAPG